MGKNNGAFGRKVTEEEKRNRSIITTRMWQRPEIRKKIQESIQNFALTNGYWPGTDKKSVQKRQATILQKYGVSHNWMVKDIRDKCEKTCLKLYGKYSWQIANDALKLIKTNIEIIIENILIKNNIVYQYQYEIEYDGERKIYDFFIPKYNLLIEADGDFWHGNPSKFPKSSLLEVQQNNQKNDKIKEQIAKKYGFKLIRFWEEDILKENFDVEFMKML